MCEFVVRVCTDAAAHKRAITNSHGAAHGTAEFASERDAHVCANERAVADADNRCAVAHADGSAHSAAHSAAERVAFAAPCASTDANSVTRAHNSSNCAAIVIAKPSTDECSHLGA